MPPDPKRKKVRLTKAAIMVRREIVAELSVKGYLARDIADAILAVPETAYLLSQQADPLDVVYEDLEVNKINRPAVAVARLISPLQELHAFRDRKLALLNVAWNKMHDSRLPSATQTRWAMIYADASDALGRSGGVPVDKPAFQIDFTQVNAANAWLGSHPSPDSPASQNGVTDDDDPDAPATIEGVLSGSSSPVIQSFGLVDIYTFATHEDFCALDLRDKPMQQNILRDFARMGTGYNELVCICGRRSGKGTIGSVLAWYKIYRLMEMSDPQRSYGLTRGQTIGTVNMAMSEDQAKKGVFKHIKDRIDHGGRWFQQLRGFCETHIPHWRLELELRLPKNLTMLCGHSKASSKVGGTNIAILFDELCKYKSTEGVDNAEQVYQQMKASTAQFGEDALIASLSSPEWELDYGMQLLGMAMEFDDSDLALRCKACRIDAERPDYVPQHRKSHPRMFGIKMATWEANTSYTREGLWDTQNGSSNPRAFMQEFGAEPSASEESYYPDPGRWDRQADLSLVDPYENGRLREDWKPCCDSRRFVHVDLGLTRDAAGMAMAHKPVLGCRYFEKIAADGKLIENPAAKKVVVDIVLRIKPPARSTAERIEIDFEFVRNLIVAWDERGFKIKGGRVTYDGFQSVDSRQLLRKKGFRAGLLSVDKNLEHHDTCQELINQDDVAYPPHPVLIAEAKQLRIKNGRKVDHPAGGSKDVIDAAAAAVSQAYRKGGRVTFVGSKSTFVEREE